MLQRHLVLRIIMVIRGSVCYNSFVLRIIMVIRGQHATTVLFSGSLWLLGVSMLQHWLSGSLWCYSVQQSIEQRSSMRPYLVLPRCSMDCCCVVGSACYCLLLAMTILLLCPRGQHLSGVWWEGFRRAIWNTREQHSPQLQCSTPSPHQPPTPGQNNLMLCF